MENFIYVQNKINAELIDNVNRVFGNTVYNRKHIKRVNRRCIVATMVSGFLFTCVCSVIEDNKQKIEKLTKEIEEMKSQKGE